MEDTKEKNSSKKNIVIACFLVLIAIIVSIILYARYVGTTGLEVIETAITDNDLPSTFEGFKVVTISDICYGKTTTIKDIKKMVKKVNELNPDLILFLGDLFDKEIKIRDKDVDNLKEEFKNLNAAINKYAVKGDHDYSNDTEYETILKYADFTVLDNTNDLIFYKGNLPIKIVGTSSLLNGKIDYESAYKSNTEDKYFTILMAHEPNIVNTINDYDTDVVFAGHSLGGQIDIPFVGGMINFAGSDNYLKGEYDLKNKKLYVNSGIGTHQYPFRWFNRPSINLYRLYSK